MTARWAVAAVLGLVLGIGVPAVGMAMLAPQLAESPKAQAVNYRGRQVFYGLGVVWLLWAGSAIIGGVVSAGLLPDTVLPVLTLAGPLALVAFALGVVDDAYGTGAVRGFRGHVRALFVGRLTTGGAKLLGIGLASLVVGFVLSTVAPWGQDAENIFAAGRYLAALLAGAAIALTSNLLNLVDLRPGRALKTYVVLAALGLISTAGLLAAPSDPLTASVSPLETALAALVLALFLIGPVVATWRYDVGERGMLGDSGANPMGAVAGMLVVFGLPLWALIIYATVVLVLNAASERFSFSEVIEGNPVLRWLDNMGRMRSEETTTNSEVKSANERV